MNTADVQSSPPRSMRDVGQRVVRTSLYRAVGYTLGAALQLAVIVLVARYLGTAGFGHFAFILACARLFQLIADMGVRHILIRDLAADSARFAQQFGLTRLLLWGLSLLSFGLIVLIANLFNLSDDVRQATYLAGLAVLIMFHALGDSAVLQAFGHMALDISGFVLHKVVLLAATCAIIFTDFGLRGVFAALLVANMSHWLFFRTALGRLYGRPPLSWDLRAAWLLLAEALPLGVAEMIKRLTWEVDKLALAVLAGPTAVGLFSGVYKLLEAMQPFRTHLALPLFPVFSKLARDDQSQLFRLYEQSLKCLYLLGIPLAVLIWAFADRLVALLFGAAYHDAALVLQLLSPAMLLLMPTSIYGYIFTALGQQRRYTCSVALALAVNILMDIALVPAYSYRGAAIGTSLAEVTLFIAGIVLLKRLGKTTHHLRELFSWLWRSSLAGLAMAWVCRWGHGGGLLSIAASVLGGLVVYGLLLYLSRTVTQPEIAFLYRTIRRRQAPDPEVAPGS